MVEYEIKCIDGCGTVLGRVTFPDGTKYPGDAHYGFMVPAHHAARVEAEKEAQEQGETVVKAADELAERQRIIAELRRQGLIL
jgi:hypothetical protein